MYTYLKLMYDEYNCKNKNLFLNFIVLSVKAPMKFKNKTFYQSVLDSNNWESSEEVLMQISIRKFAYELDFHKSNLFFRVFTIQCAYRLVYIVRF